MIKRPQTKTADSASSHDRLEHLATQIEAISAPLLKSKSTGVLIDTVVVLAHLQFTLDRTVRGLKGILRPLLPEPKQGEALVCNGNREHVEFASVCQASIDPAMLFKKIDHRQFVQCVEVLLGRADEVIGKAKADRFKDFEWVTHMRTRRGRHPSPHFDVRKRVKVRSGST